MSFSKQKFKNHQMSRKSERENFYNCSNAALLGNKSFYDQSLISQVSN